MDWPYKAVLTAAVVAAVMMAARLSGRHLAGLLAGLPVITTPALLWLAAEQGAAFAAQSAVGSLAACAAAALFAGAFERCARRHGAGRSLAIAMAALGVAMLALRPLAGDPLLASCAAVVACALVHRAVAGRRAPCTWVRPLRGEPWLSAALAGVVSAGVSLQAQQVGPFWSGMLSTLPIVSACALVHLRVAGAAADVSRFVPGYVVGLLAKVVFLLMFALLVEPAGVAIAVVLALGTAAAGVALPAAWRQRGGARASSPAGP
jgi:hypothetical protein